MSAGGGSHVILAGLLAGILVTLPLLAIARHLQAIAASLRLLAGG